MYHAETDRLRLIDYTLFEDKSFFGKVAILSFEHLLPPLVDHYQEVFRGSIPVGSVLPLNSSTKNGQQMEPVKVCRGDIVYRIYALPKIYPIVGTIQTRDRYQRLYEVNVEVQISNALQFAHMYHHGKDPGGNVMDLLKETFEKNASYFEHDRLDQVTFSLDGWAKNLQQSFGVAVHYTKPVFRFDDHRSRETKIRHEATLSKFVLEIQHDAALSEEDMKRDLVGRQKQYDRDEKSKQSEFIREEKLKYHINEAKIKLLTQSVDELVSINRERLRDAVDYNGSFKAVLEDSLKLLNAFQQPLEEHTTVVNASVLNGTEELLPQTNGNDDLDPTNLDFSIVADAQGLGQLPPLSS